MLKLFFDAKQTAQNAKKILSKEWYFSPEGRKAYNEACKSGSGSISKKTRFFLEYLLCLKDSRYDEIIKEQYQYVFI